MLSTTVMTQTWKNSPNGSPHEQNVYMAVEEALSSSLSPSQTLPSVLVTATHHHSNLDAIVEELQFSGSKHPPISELSSEGGLPGLVRLPFEQVSRFSNELINRWFVSLTLHRGILSPETTEALSQYKVY